MRNPAVIPALGAALAAALLSACGAPGDTGASAPEPMPADEAPIAPAAGARPAEDVANDGYPDLTPPRLAPEAEKGEPGARSVLLSFARAIELEEFDQAYAMLEDSARQQMTRAEFNALFEGFGKITVAVPGGVMEGAAGSSYYEAPATVSGSSGKELTGAIVLRRVNDVPGATAEQLRWRVYRVELAPAA